MEREENVQQSPLLPSETGKPHPASGGLRECKGLPCWILFSGAKDRIRGYDHPQQVLFHRAARSGPYLSVYHMAVYLMAATAGFPECSHSGPSLPCTHSHTPAPHSYTSGLFGTAETSTGDLKVKCMTHRGKHSVGHGPSASEADGLRGHQGCISSSFPGFAKPWTTL